MNKGIVGHEAAKFTPETEAKAKALIEHILLCEDGSGHTLVSGRCPLGGIDVWAEEFADTWNIDKIIHSPKVNNWTYGYKPRNILIAKDSLIVHNIVVKEYPENYKGMRFDFCYHCNTKDHIKSGGCWTAKYAQKLGKKAIWHVI